MAATEVIQFPFHVQLELGLTCPAYACNQSTALPPGSPPPLLDLLQSAAGSASFSSAAGGLGL